MPLGASTALLISASQAVTDTIRSAFDTARLVVLIAILVRRSMEPTGRGAASNIGQPIPTVGGQATITLSEGAQSAVGLRMLVPTS